MNFKPKAWSFTISAVFLGMIGFSTVHVYADEAEPVEIIVDSTEQEGIEMESETDENIENESVSQDPEIFITAHVAQIGWQEPVNEGEQAGTVGMSLPMEAVSIDWVDSEYEGDIEYRSHIANIGWESDWTSEISGTTGKSLAMEAIQIRLTGQVSDYYDIYYRSHIANIGWTGWTYNGMPSGSQGYGYSLQALQIRAFKKGQSDIVDNKQAFYGSQLQVQTHVSNIGWMQPVKENTIAGTTGQSLPVEAIVIDTSGLLVDGDVEYSAYVRSDGWQNPVSSGTFSGTVGQAKRIEAIRMNLTGELADTYDLYYQSHVSNIGWMDWAKNGQNSGTVGCDCAIEAIKLILVEKGKTVNVSTKTPFYSEGLSYKAHVSNIGWQPSVKDGQLAGTTGRALSVEAIQIDLGALSDQSGIEYQTHIANVGWEPGWSKNGSISGTVGQAQAIQAIRIVLTGDIAKTHNIYYRTHISEYGWLDWTSNGKISGSEGLNKSIEAIEITLEEKKTEGSQNTISHLICKDGITYVDQNGTPLKGWQITNDYIYHYANLDSSLNYAANYNSRGIPTLYIDLRATDLGTLESGSKNAKYPGQFVSIFDKDHQEYCLSASDVEIKGRGNSTWKVSKKPYQIKFDTKTSVLGMPAAKKWVLLANYYDDSGLCNVLAADLAEAMDLEHSQYSFVDLYINGSYRGNYLIVQKVDIGKNMIPLKDEKGVLMEVDGWYPEDEEYVVHSQRGIDIVLKEAVKDEAPDALNLALASFIETYNHIEDALTQKSWEDLKKYADVESFAKYYLINELAENPDCNVSSFYMYKDGDRDVIHAGPIWDFDVAFGRTMPLWGYTWNPNKFYVANTSNYTKIYSHFFRDMMRIPEFYNMVCDMWQNTLYPAAIEEMDTMDTYYDILYASKRDDNIIWSHQDFQSAFNELKTWYTERVHFINMIFGEGYKEASSVQLGTSVVSLTHLGDGWYTISSGDGVYTISDTEEATHSIYAQPYDGSFTQQWRLYEKDGLVKIINKATGQAIQYFPQGIAASINEETRTQWHTLVS